MHDALCFIRAVALPLPQIVEEIVAGIVEKIPEPFDVQEVMEKYPVLYEESMNTVLIQEAIR